MKISSVETTPNPNSIKLNFFEPLGPTATYTSSSQAAPDFVIKLLAIEGVQSVFVCGDFITLNRHPLSDWRLLLELATFALTGDKLSGLDSSSSSSVTALEGQNQILVQTFRSVPIQVKAVDIAGETRLSLGSAFNEAAQLIQKETGADFLKERLWLDHGLRYGERAEVAEQVLSELQNYFSPERLDLLVRQELGASGAEPEADLDQIKRLLSHSQWQQRLLAVQELSRIDSSQSVVCIDLLIESLQDSNAQVRRLAAAALGTTGSALAVPSLCQAITSDSSIAVRRTAGDALSDIGDLAAHPAMCLALSDENKLVRWRAARFLNDLGTEESLHYLEAALNDSEYEVFLEISAAIERIKSGVLGAGPAWKRIADR
ncbi:virulence factor [bacterium]|nr:virulence factor [bacterium]MBP9807213.1 virulence factor [bacterium]